MLLLAVSLAVPGILLHRLAVRGLREQNLYRQEAFLAMGLTAHLEDESRAAGAYGEWMQRVAQLTRRVHWAGVVRADGTGLEFRRRTSQPQDEIIAQIDVSATAPGAKPLVIGGVKSQRFELLTIPRPEEDVTLAVILDQGQTEGHPDLVAAVWLFCLMGLGLVGSWAWFHYGIERPLQQYANTLVTVHEGLSEAVAATMPPSELTGLVKCVEETRRELKKWQAEASCLRRSVDTKVDVRTRQAALAQRRAEREAGTDALTRLWNRRAIDRELPALFDSARRSCSELSLVVLDVDRFKQLNDTQGHQRGDELLAFLGELIRATIRKGTDQAARYGGDEFVLVLPGTSASEACTVAERLVTLFAQRAKMIAGADQPPTLSAGVAAARQHGAASAADLLQMADAAMYWAKRQQSGVATVRDAQAGRAGVKRSR